MTRFMHLADIHLDSPFYSIKDENKRIVCQNEQRLIFKNTILEAKTLGVDFILISGDLLDKETASLSTLKYLNEVFEAVKIPILLIAGNHDTELILKVPFSAKNVYVLNDLLEEVCIKDCVIYSPQSQCKNRTLKDGYYHILMWHGDFQNASGENPLPAYCKNLGFQYIAMGHHHSFEEHELNNTKICYPGCLLSRGFDELGEKGYLLVDVENGNETIQFKKVEQRKYHVIKINVEKLPDSILSTVEEIKKKILCENDCYEIVFYGYRTDYEKINFNLLNLELEKSAFLIKWKDFSLYRSKSTEESLFVQLFLQKMDALLEKASTQDDKNHIALARELGLNALKSEAKVR